MSRIALLVFGSGLFVLAGALGCSSSFDGSYLGEGELFIIKSAGDQHSLEIRPLEAPSRKELFPVVRQGDTMTGEVPLFGPFSVRKTEAGIHVIGFGREASAKRLTPDSDVPAPTSEELAGTLRDVFAAEVTDCVRSDSDRCGAKMSDERREFVQRWLGAATINIVKTEEVLEDPVRHIAVTAELVVPEVDADGMVSPEITWPLIADAYFLLFKETRDPTVRLRSIDGQGRRGVPNVVGQKLFARGGLFEPKGVVVQSPPPAPRKTPGERGP